MNVSGKIKVMFPIQEIGNNGFTKKEFVLETEGDYPELVKFELIKDKCSLLDNFEIDDNINVEFNLKGREWNGKYFTNLQAWRIKKLLTEGAPVESNVSEIKKPQSNESTADKNDDLPF